MAKVVVFKPTDIGVKDNYQGSVSTNYYKDQTTGELFKTSGNNVRTIIPEQFKSVKFISNSNFANNTDNRVYQIPQGKIFILTSGTYWQNADALSTGNSSHLDADSFELTYIRGTAAATNITFPLNYSALMVFDENTDFRIYSSNAKITAGATLLGYEIDKSEYLGVFN
jgi:hypothetical protein